jgi:hypothetical protein
MPRKFRMNLEELPCDKLSKGSIPEVTFKAREIKKMNTDLPAVPFKSQECYNDTINDFEEFMIGSPKSKRMSTINTPNDGKSKKFINISEVNAFTFSS